MPDKAIRIIYSLYRGILVLSIFLVYSVNTAAQDESCKFHPAHHYYINIKTNMLYDALLVPNAGIEACVGRDFSVGLNWAYAWWSHRVSNKFWRIYGGDIYTRWWFGEKHRLKHLTGHHIGIYAQILTYDFEFGGKGYMSGKPGKNLFARMSYGAGAEYGFSLPIHRCLNIDFTIGFGYLGGKYYEYEPIDGHYVWLRTRNRQWLGPTKAEVSLVWLIGHTNKKGGGNGL